MRGGKVAHVRAVVECDPWREADRPGDGKDCWFLRCIRAIIVAMNARLLPLLAALLAGTATGLAGTVDIPTGFVPPGWVVEGVRKTLSPQGKFVVLNQMGVVRVTDSEEKIAEVHRVLATLQKAPSVVSLNMGFITYVKKTTTVPVTSQGGGGNEFPFPRKFSPPRIVQGPNGSVTAIPAQPSQFTGRATGASGTVTQNVTKVEQSKQLARRILATSIPDKPAPVVLLPLVQDVKGLHDFAVKVGAVGQQEPAWTTASTELLVTTELVGSELRVTVTPQIALPGAAPGQERRIPVKACSAQISITRSIPAPTGRLPQADGEFYRLFMGLPPGGPEDFTALNLTGEVRFVGTQPAK
jgi:hypothetical protein